MLDAADDFDGGDTETALDWLDADLRGSTAADQTLKKLIDDIYPGWQTIAASYTGKQVIAYEGGLEIAAPSTARLTVLEIDTGYSALIAALFDAYKADWRCRRLVYDQFKQFMAQANAFAPSWFVLAGTSQWSLLEGDIYSTKRESYQGVRLYNDGRVPFRITVAAA